MRAPGLLVSAFLVLALAPLSGCDWRTFDDIKAHTPVLSVAEPNNFGVNGDFGRVVLPLASPEAGAKGGRFLVDGGASANNLLLQLQADLLQRPVVRPRVIETTALGAAFLAGLTKSWWISDAPRRAGSRR